jgi:chromosome segregation protein
MDKGAHFYRCDLQVHTPRDIDWTGMDCVSDEDRSDYASRFIQACRQKELDAVAITDHHDLAFVKYIREAAKTELDDEGTPVPKDKRIIVFPGIELTLNVPCQALLIFDAELPEDLFSLALTALAITPSDPSKSKTAQVARLEHMYPFSPPGSEGPYGPWCQIAGIGRGGAGRPLRRWRMTSAR